MTSSTRSTTRRVFSAVAVALTAATLSACSGGGIDAGAAAVVGDRRISVADVQSATTEINVLTDPDGTHPEKRFDQRTVLSFLVTGPYFVQAAANAGLGVSEQDAQAIFTGFQFQDPTTKKVTKFVDPATGSTKPSTAALETVRSVLARQKLNPSQDGSGPVSLEQAVKIYEGVSAQLKATHVAVNPRYGTLDRTFDPNKQGAFVISASAPDWLVPAPAPATPSPAAS